MEREFNLYEVNYQFNQDGMPKVARLFARIKEDYDTDPDATMSILRARIAERIHGKFVIETVKKILEHTDDLFVRKFGNESEQIKLALK